jgi:hypothetical protein
MSGPVLVGGEVARRRKAAVRYSPEVAAAICEAVATTPRGLDWLSARRPDFPTGHVIREWRQTKPEFKAMLAEAQRMQGELLMYQGLEIADDDRFDTETVEHRDGSSHERMNFEWVGRCKLAVETRFKFAAKLDPARWGEKLDANLNVGMIRHEDALAQLR